MLCVTTMEILSVCAFTLLLVQGGSGFPAAETVTESAEQETLTNDIHYLLYTRSHPQTYRLLGNVSLDQTDFNKSLPTVFLIHGFTGSGTTTSVTIIRDALLYTENLNVVVVHWELLAAGPDYEIAANNTAIVARHFADTLDGWIANEDVSIQSLHVIGFSLGAQVAGIAGSFLRTGKLPRITGLDPAKPMFSHRSNAGRLDASDAEFVLALHTSGGLVSFEEPVGHADFYPNGGKSPQPGCIGKQFSLVCSHLISPIYFAESIYKQEAFPASSCSSWTDFQEGLCQNTEQVFLGPHTPSSARGQFFLRTNSEEPYGQSILDFSENALEEDGDRRKGRRIEAEQSSECTDCVSQMIVSSAITSIPNLSAFLFPTSVVLAWRFQSR